MLVIFILLVITIASIIKNSSFKECNFCCSILSMLKSKRAQEQPEMPDDPEDVIEDPQPQNAIPVSSTP